MCVKLIFFLSKLDSSENIIIFIFMLQYVIEILNNFKFHKYNIYKM